MKSRAFRLTAMLLVVAGLACTPDDVGGPDPEVQEVDGVADLQTCTAGFYALVPGTGITLTELADLAEDFNDRVIDAAGLTSSDRAKLRRITTYGTSGQVPSGSLETITVSKDSTGSGNGWCGVNFQNGIDVSWCQSGGPTDPTAFQNRATTILHELWNRMNSNSNKLGDWDAAAGCSLHAGSDPTTTVPCVHEVQYEYDHCGVRPVSLTEDVDLFVGVDISGPSTLEEDEDAQYTASFTSTSGGSLPPLVFGTEATAPSTVDGVRHVGDEGLVVLDPARTWTSSSHLDVSCQGCNPTTVVGAEAGSGQLTVTVEPAGNVVYPEPTKTKDVNVEADDPPPPPDPPPVASIELSPTTVLVGQPPPPTVTATAYDSSGNPLSGVTFNWSVRDPSIAYLGTETDDSVQVWPNQNGTTTVTARVGIVKGTAAVEVDCGPFACF